jgi:hypothetical protein
MRKIGFTGTRHGMTDAQKKAVKDFLSSQKFNEFHHGDCIGSDKDANDIVDEFRAEGKKVKIVGHPPTYNKYRAYCKCDILLAKYDYLTRNQHIVDTADILVATPDTKERLHSGTWSTIRYARKKDKKIFIFNRNGEMRME